MAGRGHLCLPSTSPGPCPLLHYYLCRVPSGVLSTQCAPEGALLGPVVSLGWGLPGGFTSPGVSSRRGLGHLRSSGPKRSRGRDWCSPEVMSPTPEVEHGRHTDTPADPRLRRRGHLCRVCSAPACHPSSGPRGGVGQDNPDALRRLRVSVTRVPLLSPVRVSTHSGGEGPWRRAWTAPSPVTRGPSTTQGYPVLWVASRLAGPESPSDSGAKSRDPTPRGTEGCLEGPTASGVRLGMSRRSGSSRVEGPYCDWCHSPD